MPDIPHRIQRSRAKGWRMPPDTVSVSRPNHAWGNPWRIERRPGGFCCHDTRSGLVIQARDEADARDLALSHFRAWVTPHADLIREHLRGKNLACWCRLDQPCHADILLEIANG
jgi:hypothetical protein